SPLVLRVDEPDVDADAEAAVGTGEARPGAAPPRPVVEAGPRGRGRAQAGDGREHRRDAPPRHRDRTGRARTRPPQSWRARRHRRLPWSRTHRRVRLDIVPRLVWP